ncbi:hypothetical protein E2493_10095 [Sphingomonas parva]|uniref:RapA2 cadherin-like domain-containing protein n=1 Tax=Sphingomonas parva TaxID=2555898 RepID=A0A4Y8ZUA3_9SPHN|nr:Ig-like domain-containing protein [Sphingomonas parva]TFI58329.1 hypothetical protein E2493_10095 [Sphingomonas parva]
MPAGLTVTRVTKLFHDRNGNGIQDAGETSFDSGEAGVIDPGDGLYTRVTILNSGDTVLTNVTFQDSFANTALVSGLVNVSPIAFNDSFTAVGNTVLRVGEAGQAAVGPGGAIGTGPSYIASGNLLANDVGSATLGLGAITGDDIPGFQIVATSGVSAQGGSFTIFADGSFNYVNEAGDTGTDSFTYQIRDAGYDATVGTADDLVSTATVSITLTGEVWYVDAAAAAGVGTGTSDKPFQSITELNTANKDGVGDTIYVKGNATGGIVLDNGQLLIGQGADLNVAGHSLATAGANSSITSSLNNSYVVTVAQNNTIAGLNIVGNGTNTGGITDNQVASFGTLSLNPAALNAATPAYQSTITASGAALNLSDGAIAGNGFSSTTSAGGVNNVSLTNITGTVALGSGTMSGSSADSVAISGGTLNATYSGSISHSAAGSALINVSGGHSTGTLTFSGAKTSTDGTGLQFNNADGTYTVSGTTTINGGTAGIAIANGSGGTFSFAGTMNIGQTTDIGGIAVSLADSTAAVNLDADVKQTTGSFAILDVTNHSGGTLTFQTTASFDASSGTGMQFSNADGSYNMNSANTLHGGDAGIDIDTGSSGTFSFLSNTAITSPTGAAFNIDNSTAAVTFNGNITQANNAAMVNVNAHSGATLSFQQGTLNATGGTGLQFNNADGTYNFNTVNGTTSLNGGDAGIDIVGGSDGTFTFASGVTLGTATGTNFNVNGGGGNITVNGTINDDQGTLVAITGRTGGTIDFNGAITDGFDGDGGGISITNNTGGTTRFDGGLLLSTGASNALTVTNSSLGSTIEITDPAGAGNNKLATTSGTALNVTNVNIGAADLTFEKIESSGGSANGIILNNTGNAGGLHVTGTGTAGTGGTISGKTGADGSDSTVGTGIYLNSTADVQLASMNVHTNSNFGIRGLNVNGFQLTDSNIGGGGTNGSSAAPNEGSIVFGTLNSTNGLTGTVTINNTTIANGFEYGLGIFNNSGTANVGMSGLTVTGTLNNDGIFAGVKSGGTLNIAVNNSIFSNNKGDHFNASADGTGNLAVQFGNGGANTLTGTFVGGLGEGIAIQTGLGWSGTGSAIIANNTITFAKDTPINVNVGGTGTFGATILNNIIGNAAQIDSGTNGNKDAIRLIANGDGAGTNGGTLNALVQGNQLNHVDGRGIFSLGRNGGTSGDPIRLNLTIIGNTFQNSPEAQSNAIRIEAGAANNERVDVLADIGGTGGRQNIFNGDWGSIPVVNSSEIRLLHDITDNTNVFHHFNLTNYAGSPTDDAAVIAYLAGRNTLNGGVVSVARTSPNTWGTGGTPPQPLIAAEFAPIPLQPYEGVDQTSSQGGETREDANDGGDLPAPLSGSDQASGSEGTRGGDDSVPTPPAPSLPPVPVVIDDGVLSRGELDLIVAAAIDRWEAAGATPAQLAAMRATNVSVANLGGLLLGESGAGAITLDDNAAGWRWFIDATPGDDAEYRGSGSQRFATSVYDAAGTRVDLLTVVMHELGHQIGLYDSYAPGDRDALMFGTVRAGERRLPGSEDVGAAGGAPVTGAFAVSPINLGTLNPGMSVTIEFRSTVNSVLEDKLAFHLKGESLVTSDTVSASSAETLAVDSLTLGNRVFVDTNKSGIFDGGDSGIAGVTLSLFADTNNSDLYEAGTDLAIVYEDVNNNNVYDPGVDTPLAAGSSGTGPNGGTIRQLTATTDASGFYSFAGLAPGDYIVRVDAANFATVLANRVVLTTANDPDDDVDNDNNGQAFAGYVATRAITLSYNGEVVAGPTGPDLDTNDTLDIGFDIPNQPPVIANVQGNSVTFTEGDSAVKIDALSDATVSDVDSSNYNGGSLTVSISAGKNAGQDELGIDDSGSIDITAGIVSIGGVNFGTVTGGGAGGGDLVVTFNSVNADDVRVQTLIRALTFYNSGGNAPAGGARTISTTLVDGGGRANSGDDDATVTSTVNVVPINSAPAGADNSKTIAEDTPYAFVYVPGGANDFGFSDTDGNSFAGVTIVTMPTDGELRLDGVTLSGSNVFVAAQDIADGKLVFHPSANEFGVGYASFTFKVRDDGDNTPPSVNQDPNADTFSFDVTAVNDAPVNAVPSATQTFNEDTTLTFNTANGNLIAVSDVDLGGGELSVSLSVQTGTLTLSDKSGLSSFSGDVSSAVTLLGTQGAINAALNGLVYNPGANYNGNRTITIVTNDQGSTGADPGGPGDLGSEEDSDTIAVHVTAINDAPVVIGDGTVDAATFAEDTTAADTISTLFSAQYSDSADAQFGAGNPGGSSPGSFAGVAVVANGSSGATGQWQYLNSSTSTWVDVGARSAASALLIGSGTFVRFNPAANFNGSAPTLTVHLIDNSLGFGISFGQVVDISGPGATGTTTAYSTGTVLLSQQVTAVNDAPVNTVGGPISINEDAVSVVLSDNVSPMSVSDVEATGDISYNLLVQHGTLTIRTDVAGGIQASDIQSGPGVGNGTSSLVITATIAEINTTLAAANALLYNPAAHYNGTDFLDVYVNDGGQTGADPNPASVLDPLVDPDVGPFTEEDVDTRTITIAAVNDAPVLSAPTSATITFTEGDTSVALLQGVTLNDVDLPASFTGGSLSLSVTGGAGSGGINLRSGSNFHLVDLGGGLFNIVYQPAATPFTIGSITGYGTPSMAISGLTSDATLARLNDLVDDFVYVIVGENPAAGSRTVTLTFDDGGNTGGGALTDDVTQTLNVVAVNDAPTIAAPLTRAGSEDANLVFSGVNAISVADVDATNLQVTLSVLHGTMTLAGTAGLFFSGPGGNGSGVMTFEGSASAINTALDGLAYRGALNFEGSDTLSISVNDKGATGTPGTQTASRNISITLADDGFINGTSGIDHLDGTSGADFFRLEQGGDDDVGGFGGADIFYMGGAYTANDLIDGHDGIDTLALQGDYSGGVSIGGNLDNVDTISLLSGSNTRFGEPGTNRFDYVINILDSAFAGGVVRVNGGNLLAGEDFTFNASAEQETGFVIYGGLGVDTFTGGHATDIFFFGDSNSLGAGDTVNGGDGYDGLFLRGDYSIDFNAPGFLTAFTSIENITLSSASDERHQRGGDGEFDYSLIWRDSLLATGATITINGGLLLATETMAFDGASESGGRFRLFAGAAADTLTGGSGADLIYGGGGGDTLRGNGGADVFRYDDVMESRPGAGNFDQILDFTHTTDKIDVHFIDAKSATAAHDTFTFIGAAAFSGAGGEVRAIQVDVPTNTWQVQADVSGDGLADLLISVVVDPLQALTAGDFVF